MRAQIIDTGIVCSKAEKIISFFHRRVELVTRKQRTSSLPHTPAWSISQRDSRIKCSPFAKRLGYCPLYVWPTHTLAFFMSYSEDTFVCLSQKFWSQVQIASFFPASRRAACVAGEQIGRNSWWGHLGLLGLISASFFRRWSRDSSGSASGTPINDNFRTN